MMTLEQRAQHAAQAVQIGSAAYEPRAGVADVARRQLKRRAAGAAVAAMAVFALLMVGTWFAGAPDEEVAEPLPPSIPTIDEPAPVPPLVPVVPGPSVDTPPVDEPPKPVEPQEPGEDPLPDVGVLAGPPVTQAPPTTSPPPPATTVAVDTTPPALAITSPLDGETFDRKTIRFRGTTEPGASVIAGRYEADVDEEGNWSIVLVLFEGGNRPVFRATDAAGNETTARITVYYDKPIEEPPAGVDFTAFATYGSCSFDPPYDVYYGTAEPAKMVTTSSEYGGGTTFANDDGHWELKVFFPEAPSEVVFLVTVKAQAGHTKKFEFVSLVPA